jgi:hypothetical protein
MSRPLRLPETLRPWCGPSKPGAVQAVLVLGAENLQNIIEQLWFPRLTWLRGIWLSPPSSLLRRGRHRNDQAIEQQDFPSERAGAAVIIHGAGSPHLATHQIDTLLDSAGSRIEPPRPG